MQNEKGNGESSEDHAPVDHTLVWIGILIILILILNALFFYVYNQSHTGNLFLQLWTYLGSDIFKAITITIILPIIVLFLNKFFDIKKSAQERRDKEISDAKQKKEKEDADAKQKKEKEEQDRKERTEKEKQEEISKQWKCIEQTAKSWYDLSAIITTLAFFRSNSVNSQKGRISLIALEQDKKESLEDIHKELWLTSTNWYWTMNNWYSRFPNLWEGEHLRFEDEMIYFLNLLFRCSETVVYNIEQASPEAENLQNSLLVILQGAHSLVYHRLFIILKASIDVRKVELSKEIDKDEETKSKTAQQNIEEKITELQSYYKELKDIGDKNYEFLPILQNENTLKDARKEVLTFVKEKSQEYVDQKTKKIDETKLKEFAKNSKEYKSFKDKFEEDQNSNLMRAETIKCAPKLVKLFASWFALDAHLNEIVKDPSLQTNLK